MHGGNDDVRRVLEATDIVRVVGDAVQLRPKGREFVCLCPFHEDRNPSMYVVPAKQIFHCFVCGAGGDALTFTRRYHGLSFPEALKMLAERAGVELTPRRRDTPNSGEDRPERQNAVGRATVRKVNAAAQGFYQRILVHPEHGTAARGVVERRGISAEMLERFCIGAAPDRWDGLLLYAKQAGIPERDLEGAGLVKRRDAGRGGGLYDALRNRLIFPILGESGETLGFGARRIDDADEPKYLNSPETALFKKSETLFGLHQARDAIRREGWVAVVEGYTDVIACHQHGIENVVGTLGTALTAEHARRLRWKCDRVVLLFDGDEAGQRAANRAFEVLFSGELDVSVAVLSDVTDAKDPDELLAREGGREMLLKALTGGRDLVEMHFGRLREQARGKGAAGARRMAEDEVRRLWDAGMDRMEPRARTGLLARIAESVGVRFEVVEAAVKLGRRADERRDEGGSGPATPARALTGRERLWAELVACALSDPEAATVVLAGVEAGLDPGLEGIDGAISGLVVELARAGDLGLPAVLSELPDDRHRARAAGFVRRIESLVSTGDAKPKPGTGVVEHAEDCLARLRSTAALEGSGEARLGGADSGSDGMESIAARLRRMQDAHAEHGSNPGARFWKGSGGGRP